MEKWQEVLGGIAPVLAGALGGPFAAAAAKIIADKVLGRPDASEDDVKAAIASGSLSGDQLIALKAAEQQFQLDVHKITAETERAYLLDVQDARARQVATKDLMPNYIFWLMAVLYTGATLLLYFGPVPPDDFTRSLLVKSFSIVELGFTGSFFYFIGTSNGSKRSGDAVRKIAENSSK